MPLLTFGKLFGNFSNKTGVIYQAFSPSAPPHFSPSQSVHPFSTFLPTNTSEVEQLINKSNSSSCQLGPISAHLLKNFLPTLNYHPYDKQIP